MFGPKIKIEQELYDRVKEFADIAGYASIDEFVAPVLEKEISSPDEVDSEEEMKNRLRGLDYIS